MVFFSRNNKIIFYIVCFLALVSILYRWNFKFDKEYKFFNKESTSIRPKNYIIQILKEPTEIRKNYSIFCLIKTHPGSIESKKTLYVYKIWARKCDNYRFVTLLPKELVPSNSSKSEVIEVFNKYYMIQPDNYEYENHDNLTHKLYSSIRYIYSKYPNYDWYHIVDDDAYVNLNNFRNFLSTKDSSKPITFGFEFKIIVDGGYHSGGPGYTLSKEAFTRIGKALSKDMKYCQNTGIDDVDVNACLRTLNVTISPSIDKNFKQRYLVFDLNSHFYGNFPDWIHSYSRYPIYSKLNCCSDEIIAVHYMSPTDMLRLDYSIEVFGNELNLYAEFFRQNKTVTFKDVMQNYILLENYDNFSNQLKQLD